MQVLLNQMELKFLLENVKVGDIIQILKEAQTKCESLAKGQYTTRRIQIELSDKEGEEMLDILSTLLMEKGVGDGGELNAIGFEVEALIDLFGRQDLNSSSKCN